MAAQRFALDDPPEISSNNLAKNAHIINSLQEFCKNNYALQVQKTLASFLQETAI